MSGYYIDVPVYTPKVYTQFDGTAASVGSLPGQGYYSFSVPTTTAGAVVGLSSEARVSGFTDITHGFYFSQGLFRVIESGVFVTIPTPYNATDVFIIARIASGAIGYVRYYKGSSSGSYSTLFDGNPVPGLLVFESTVNSSVGVLLKAALLSENDSVTGMTGPTIWGSYVFTAAPDEGSVHIKTNLLGSEVDYAIAGIQLGGLSIEGSEFIAEADSGLITIGPLVVLQEPPLTEDGTVVCALRVLGRADPDTGIVHIRLIAVGVDQDNATPAGLILIPNLFVDSGVVSVVAEHETTTYFSIENTHSTEYAATVSSAVVHESSYRVRSTLGVSTTHTTIYSVDTTVRAVHASTYSPTLPIFSEMSVWYSPTPPIFSEMSVWYSPTLPIFSEMSVWYRGAVACAAEHVSLYASMQVVSATHELAYTQALSITAYFDTQYNIAVPVAAQHDTTYSPVAVVAQTHRADFSWLLATSAEHTISYSRASVVSGLNVTEYSFTHPVAVELSAVYSLCGSVCKEHDSLYGQSSTVVGQGTTLWDLSLQEHLSATNSSFWSIKDDAAILEADDVRLYVYLNE